MRLDISEQQFLELLRAGLWEGKVNPALFEQADWERMMTVAEHQTMTGVVGEAMMSLPDDLVPVEWKMKTVARLVGIEDMNSRMNDFLPVLFKKLRSQGWNVWLLKGQGVGRCYPHAQRRQPGDIDVFFTNEKEYHDACKFFKKHLRPQDIKAESDETKDFEFVAGSQYVELHGAIVTELNRACRKHFGSWKEMVMKEEIIEQTLIQIVEVFNVLKPIIFKVFLVCKELVQEQLYLNHIVVKWIIETDNPIKNVINLKVLTKLVKMDIKFQKNKKLIKIPELEYKKLLIKEY